MNSSMFSETLLPDLASRLQRIANNYHAKRGFAANAPHGNNAGLNIHSAPSDFVAPVFTAPALANI